MSLSDHYPATEIHCRPGREWGIVVKKGRDRVGDSGEDRERVGDSGEERERSSGG